jgi:hypothetical protein
VVRGCDHDTLEGFVHEEDANTGPPLDPSTASTLQVGTSIKAHRVLELWLYMRLR